MAISLGPLWLAGYGAFHGGLSSSSVARRLRPPGRRNKQDPREERGSTHTRGNGVKEMLKDTINVICLPPPEAVAAMRLYFFSLSTVLLLVCLLLLRSYD